MYKNNIWKIHKTGNKLQKYEQICVNNQPTASMA
jgi:hypothetical protein